MKKFSDEDLKSIYQKYQMKLYMLIMFIKLREREEIIFKYMRDENTIMGLPV